MNIPPPPRPALQDISSVNQGRESFRPSNMRTRSSTRASNSNISWSEASLNDQNGPNVTAYGSQFGSPQSFYTHSGTSNLQSQVHQPEGQYFLGTRGQYESRVPRLRDIQPNNHQAFNGIQDGSMYSNGQHFQTNTNPYMINGRINPNILAQENAHQAHHHLAQANSQSSSPAFRNNANQSTSDLRASLTLDQFRQLQSSIPVRHSQIQQQVWENTHQIHNQFGQSSLDQTSSSQFLQLARAGPTSAEPTILQPPVLPAIFRHDSQSDGGRAFPSRPANLFRTHPIFDDEDAEQEVEVLTSFHIFPKLPGDVRLRIFTFALFNLPPRYIHLVTLIRTPTDLSVFVPTPPQLLQRCCPIRQICQQARNLISDPDIQIMNIQDSRGITTPIFFNPSKDIIVFSNTQGLDIVQQFCQVIGPSTAAKIQKICKINEGSSIHEWNNGNRGWSGRVELSKIFGMFPGLKELQFLPVQVVDKADGRGKQGFEEVLEWKWTGKGFGLRNGEREGFWQMASQFARLAYQDAWDHWRNLLVAEGADHNMVAVREMPTVRLMELVREDDL
jgi:hypothetical protein